MSTDNYLFMPEGFAVKTGAIDLAPAQGAPVVANELTNNHLSIAEQGAAGVFIFAIGYTALKAIHGRGPRR